ncbi:MAG: ribosomal protein S18-alanine N-acetyltransferase [Ruminococcus sp.]|nr:ribosomal protein S18-alanine N-acetyltransferase [Ruminococcus sp.]
MMPKADNSIIIAPAALTDMKRIAEIAELSFSDPWSERLFTDAFENIYTRIFLAKNDSGDITGYIVLSKTGDDINVDDIAVASKHRRMGIGKCLLEWSLHEYPEKDFLLEVRESNCPAIALYESMGFKQVGFRKRYYRNPDEGAVLMTREKHHE